jgi:chromosome partitioning protein
MSTSALRVTMGRVIAVANQKGGVGKTTTTVNLSTALALAGQKVLLVDIDPQANASSALGVDGNAQERTIYEALVNGETLTSVRVGGPIPGPDLIPSAQGLIGAEIELVGVSHRESVLKGKLHEIKGEYDYVLIDCPPSLGLLTINAMTAADSVLIPIQCEYYALEGLSQLLNAVRLIQKSLNPELQIEGILLTMFDARLNLSHQVADEARKFFPGRVYTSIIPRNVRISEAPSFGKPVLLYDRDCAGSESYTNLAKEVLSHE